MLLASEWMPVHCQVQWHAPLCAAEVQMSRSRASRGKCVDVVKHGHGIFI